MKAKIVFKRLSMLFAAVLLAVVLSANGDFTAYADGESFNNHWLSSDGGVVANYNASTKVLTIGGAGEVEYERWVEMAQKINPNYFTAGTYFSWFSNISEDDMDIVFNGDEKAIELCGTVDGNGLFEDFSGDIFFNDAVDLSPSATDISYMFYGATRFNQPVSFDTSNVTSMEGVFFGAESFDQPVEFDTSNVTNMAAMFSNASNFNQLLDFDTSNVTNMNAMFLYATSFNQPVNFDTRNVTNMIVMFYGATSFNQPVNFDTSNVTSMEMMFADTMRFNQTVDFDIGNVRDMQSMFVNSAVERVGLNNSSSNVDVEAADIFKGCANLKSLQFSGLKNASIEGFIGDYYVEENGGNPIAKDADEGYAFTDNQSYKVYLQIGVPTVTLSKSGSAIKVSWTAVPDATDYQVYRADKNSGPFTKFKTTGGLVYTNSGNLVPGMPYYYKVRAYRNDGGNYSFGDFSDVKGYYAPGALATPAKPNLSLDKNGNGIRLNWNAQKRITGYQVFRALSPDKPFSYLKTASGNATKYTNLAGLTQGRPYYYKIRAYRMAKGVRAYSPLSDIKGLFAGTDEQALGAVSFSLEDNPAVSAPNVRVRWTGVSGADGYCVYRWNSTAQNWTGLKKTGPNARVYTNINGVVNHKTNFYGMRTYHVSSGTTYYGNIGQAKGFRVDK